MNHLSSGAPDDGFTFVATENIPAGEIIYFTDNEYDVVTNNFTNSEEAVIKYTVGTGGLSKGVVVYMRETSTDTFVISCTSGNCGSNSVSNGSFNLATNGDGLYAYSDTDDNVVNGITEIYSVMYTGSGEAPSQNGGNIPTNQNPIGNFPNAIVVDGFNNDGDDFTGPNRIEFKFSPSNLRDGISKTAFENAENYLQYVSFDDLSIVEFTNLNLTGSKPVLTISPTPKSVNENSATSMVYTFTLDSPAVGDLVVNFSVGGTAAYTTDYSVSGATTFSASNGTVTIADGTSSKTVTITPIGDTTLEADELVILAITPSAGYDGGSPSSATVIILNDDTQTVTPMVAVTGTNNNNDEGFSFVALDDIPANTIIYFTAEEFNTSILKFVNNGDAICRWTSPNSIIQRGEVIVATESTSNILSTTCNNNICGTIDIVYGLFSLATAGESFYAYKDSNDDPFDGITEIHSVLHTGNGTTGGGNIGALQNPTSVYTGSVLVDGFTLGVNPNRAEYKFAGNERALDVDQANFQNTSNWLYGEENITLSTIPFNNIIISTGSANPIATVSVTPNSVAEDSGIGLVYTFSLSTAVPNDITINYAVGGTATFSDDYGVTGANTFGATAGSVVIPSGSTYATITATPLTDMTLEPIETVQLALTSGTGYNGGSPNDAIGSITNDDTSKSNPLVAITGLSHDASVQDAFSFVAIKDIPANTTIYFTEEEFDNTTLTFETDGEAVIQYISPATIIPAGDVIVATETGTSTNIFNITCNGATGNSCGTMTTVSGTFSINTSGESFYAYSDINSDPSDGITDIYAVLYTGSSPISGGFIPTKQDPSQIYLSALVIDGFPSTAPKRIEYDETKRNILVTNADFKNTANWLYAQSSPAELSPVPFNNLAIGNQPPMVVCKNITLPLDAMGTTTLTPDLVDNGSTDDGGSVFLAFETTSFSGETTATSPTDIIDPGTGVMYPYQASAFTVPTTGTYTFNGTGTMSSEIFYIFIWKDTPIPNSTLYDSRPEYLTRILISNNGDALTDPTITLSEGHTYYMSISDVQAGFGTYSITTNIPIITTAASSAYTCTNLGSTVNQTLYTFDQEGNTSSCVSTITISDNIAPVITCPANQVQTSQLYTIPDYFSTGEAQVTDNCTNPVTITSQTPAAGIELTPGTYTVSLHTQDANANMNSCTFELIIDTSLSLADSEIGLNSVNLHPNPSSNIVYLSNPQLINLKNASLYDMSGRLIEYFDLSNTREQQPINITNLASATYVLIVESDKGHIAKRLSKQ
ncbi:T9SS type A sorting domain-containing protein [Algibacter miyuki]|nr:T9SS type A sorting domain-containing protein [Algibacter miyuki]